MKLLNSIRNRFNRDRHPLSEERRRPVETPQGVTITDLCEYVDTLYATFDVAFQRYLENKSATDGDVAIDTLVAINRLERAKCRASV